MENKTFEFVTFAILIESLITYISQFFIQESFCWQMALSPYIGRILTGILLSRGSNFVFDLLDKFSCLLKNF